jgi:hypothetical protein
MGQIFDRFAFWTADVLLLSSILAVFEIVLEKDRGWASALGEGVWGKKLFAGNPLVRWIADKPYVTTYHLTVFGAILPIVLWTQYRIGAFLGFRSALRSGHAIADLLFLFSAFLAICVTEDFLWFALNWYYPSSLSDLLAGHIWWHTGYIPVGRSVQLPRCYISMGTIALLALATSFALRM